ncbi:MAG: hypothetical protein NTW67_01445 [Candidatus Woesearchaeota archaeon]|nr:hypothetical protein [Candidatus Woesearchaeota archaeon]
MKKILCVLLLICLAACQTVEKPIQKTTPANITDVNKAAVLEQFAKLDLELNTSWHEESIPANMIQVKAIEPWTANMMFLRDRLSEKNDTLVLDLVDARVQMLKSQLAYYLMLKVGENGTINMTRIGKTLTPAQEIDCRNSKVIAKSLGLYYSSYAAWKNFTILMDKVFGQGVTERRNESTNRREQGKTKILQPAIRRRARIHQNNQKNSIRPMRSGNRHARYVAKPSIWRN